MTNELKAKWDAMSPKERQKAFRIGNCLTSYRPWAELDEKEKQLITAAAVRAAKFGGAR